ncbi:MAG: hypothetical protein ACYC77_11875 [Coriobacteriia bacterium]
MTGLDVSAPGGWRIIAAVQPWAHWSTATFFARPSAQVSALAPSKVGESLFVSQVVFTGQECSWPPYGIQPGVLDFDWAKDDWDNRDPIAALESVRAALAANTLASVGDRIAFVCSGSKGLHLLYDARAVPDAPHDIRKRILREVPGIGVHDKGLYLDTPHGFRRLAGTVNYGEMQGVRTAVYAKQFDVSALEDGRLLQALHEQWFHASYD